MYIKCIGTGDAFGSGGRLHTSFFIRTKTAGILLDCGATTLTGLKRESLSADDIDIILISHLHGDHFGGLAFMLCEIVAMGKREKTWTIIGPPETESRVLQNLQCLYPGIAVTHETPVRFIHYATGQTLQLQSLKLTAYSAVHSPETNPHALRLEIEERVIAYSGDTEWTDSLIKVCDGAELFICEASGYCAPLKNHLTVARILEEQPRLRAKEIVLTHPGEEVLKHAGDIPLKLAADGAVLLDDDEN